MVFLKEILGMILLVGFAQAQVPFTFLISARDLPNMDIARGSPDTYVKVTVAEGNSDFYKTIRQTSILSNSNNPSWKDLFNFKFVPGVNQRLRFEIWDEDIDGDDYMGRVDATFAKIVNSPDNTLEFQIAECGRRSCGRFQITRQLKLAQS